MAKNRPVIFIDPKGEPDTLSTLVQCARLTGRENNLLYFSLDSKMSTYNPLFAGDCDPSIIIDGFLSNSQDDNAYYRDVSMMLFTHAYNILRHLGQPFTVMDMYAYLNHAQCFEDVHHILKSCPTAQKSLRTLDLEIKKLNTAHKDWRLALIGFNSYPLRFNRPYFNEADPDISISDGIRQKKIMYFALPVNAYAIQARTVAQSVQSSLRHVSSLIQSGKLPVDTLVSVYIDEFGSICDPLFVETLNKARSSGMMVTLGCQTMHDLAAISDNFMRRVDENTANKIILRQSDAAMCETIAKSIGTTMKARKTYRETTGFFGNQIMTGEASVRHVEEFILHPNKIKNLPAYGQGGTLSATRANGWNA